LYAIVTDSSCPGALMPVAVLGRDRRGGAERASLRTGGCSRPAGAYLVEHVELGVDAVEVAGNGQIGVAEQHLPRVAQRDRRR